MKLKEMNEEEIQNLSYDEIAYLVLEESGKKMKLIDLFTKVNKLLGIDTESSMEHITDFFELLCINKKFAQLPNGYWDIAVRHEANIVIEDDTDIEEVADEELEETDDIEEEEEETDIFYDDLNDDDTEDDDLKDLIIVDDDENSN